MSDWMHVSGVIRLDAIDHIRLGAEIEGAFGQTWDFDGYGLGENDSYRVPYGSEGSLQYHYEYVGTASSMVCGTMMVWGDLRDNTSVEEVFLWVKESLGRLTMGFPRDAVVKVQVEYEGSWLLFLDGEDWREIRLTDERDTDEYCYAS